MLFLAVTHVIQVEQWSSKVRPFRFILMWHIKTHSLDGFILFKCIHVLLFEKFVQMQHHFRIDVSVYRWFYASNYANSVTFKVSHDFSTKNFFMNHIHSHFSCSDRMMCTIFIAILLPIGILPIKNFSFAYKIDHFKIC